MQIAQSHLLGVDRSGGSFHRVQRCRRRRDRTRRHGPQARQ